ncbi:MAG: tRNA (adenosine(37)-N6)-threonylcarbamoyltransferase complex ATPase subunit type 1 TsaE [Neisseriaceae bacterium]|nr:tRNA (adenosine(37)-N6)-threonylcarbamoyltransferase complex ATPase subunit type 1 TsaE [Neisseriaceae bacterium]
MFCEELFLSDESKTIEYANFLADSLVKTALEISSALVIYLDGDLGAGKTTFVRGVLRSLGYTGSVKSPTYTLLEEYDFSGRLCIYHFDLYRFTSPQEWEEAGFDEILTPPALCFIEWAHQAKGYVNPSDLTIALSVHNNGRMCRITPESDVGKKIIALWKK